MSFGAAIERRRKELGLSHEAAGALMGVRQSTFTNWAAGKSRPRATAIPDLIPKLAEFLDIGTDEAAELLLEAQAGPDDTARRLTALEEQMGRIEKLLTHLADTRDEFADLVAKRRPPRS